MKSIFESCFNYCETTSFYTKFNRCEYYINEEPFMGHVVSPEGITVDPSKVRDVLDWKLPKSIHQV
jgi:hypothetical protein